MSTDTPTVTLTEFLLARIAEDEVVARYDRDVIAPLGDLQELASTKRAYSEIGYLAARVLADCEAKRRIVELHQPVNAGRYGIVCVTCGSGMTADYSVDWPCDTLCLLALPYANHPDYNPDWRP